MTMPTVGEAYLAIDSFAPFALAEGWDNCGLLVGDASAKVTRAVAALDATREVVDYARERSAQLIVTHHPVIFHGEKRFTGQSPAFLAAAAGIAVISAHTNFDRAEKGVNYELCRRLELKNAAPMTGEAEGADGERIPAMGWVGELPVPMAPMEFAWYVKAKLDTVARYVVGPEKILRAAVCGGAGASYMGLAMENGAQALVTGDVRHDRLIAAKAAGFTLIDAGHYNTELPAVALLAEQLAAALPGLEVELFPDDQVETV